MNDQQQIESLFRHFKNSNGISTDSRKIEKGMIYFALKGENFDGNKFAKDAIEKGALLTVVDEPELKGPEYFHVNNTLKSLQNLAAFARSKWEFPVLAIAGSNGKTTTKELISSVLSSNFNVFSTPGNFNNHIGLPLTLLMVPEDCNFLVLEIGANHLGEHAFLCEIAKPNFGLVTNNGKDHLEGYGSLENVIKSNSELYDYLKEHKAKVFVNADDEQLMHNAKGIESFKYGFENEADINAIRIADDLYATIKTESGIIKSNLVGEFNSINILAAAAIGYYFEIDFEDIKTAIESYQPKLNRSQLIEHKDFEIMLDAYNANPSSMNLAIKTIDDSSYPRKMVILGGMLELGHYEKEEHKKIINQLLSSSIDNIWLVGKEFEAYKNINSVQWFENSNSCKLAFESLEFKDGIILIKGSRKYQLEKLIE